MKASDLLVECLRREGVEYAFGIPGEELEDLLFSLRDSPITFVPVRHEQGAAFMADVHGRVTGEAGVCVGTLGPGATNLITGVADATLDKAPVVAITGQGGLERLHKESHQALDVVDVLAPVTKWNAQVNDPNVVHESVRKAFKVAEWEKPGATHLELPEDVAGHETDAAPMPGRDAVRRPAPDGASVDRLVELLAGADRPVLLTGNGAVRTDAAPQLRALVEATAAPAVATYMGKGAVPDRNPRSLMTLNSGDDREASEAVEAADLIVAVGYDVAEHDPADWNPGGVPIVHVDSEPAEVYAAYAPDLEIVADIPAALSAVVERCEGRDLAGDDDWYADLRERIVADVTRRPDPDEPFTVEGALVHLRDAMGDGDVLLSDVGSHKLAIAQNFPTHEPGTCIVSNGLASMGIAVPGAVAADLATDASVVAATGDGGFLMNAAELDTATRLDCGFTVVVFNDDQFRMIAEEQLEHRGETFGTELTNPDTVAFAESFGIDAYRPGNWDELGDVLETVVPGPELSLVEVPLGG